MKRYLGLFLFILSILGSTETISAQSLTPGMASQMKQRSLDIYAKIQEVKGSVGPIDVSTLVAGENKVLDELLPAIEKLLLDAGELFGQAAENLPGRIGQECLRQGCGKLKEALRIVKEAKRFVRMDGTLKVYGELLNEINLDIKDATEDAGCRQNGHNGNPWVGKKFRSEYSTSNGSWVKGTTEIFGDSGSYQTSSGEKGSLNQIVYRDNARVAEGYWRFGNGGTGWFSFTLNSDGLSFYGNWGRGDRIGQQQQGSWKGSL